MRHAFLVAMIVALVPAIAHAQRNKKVEFSDEAVEAAIEKAKTYLWSQFDANEGHWPEKYTEGSKGGNFSGCSAIANYALLAAGESYQSAKMKKAIEWQGKQSPTGPYTLGLRCQIWAALPRELGRDLLDKDVKLLTSSVSKAATMSQIAPDNGTWGYVCLGKPAGGDHSNTQYGYLGLWAGARANLEAATEKWIWEQAFKHYVMTQSPEGSWGYGNGAPYNRELTMTLAGLASTFIAFDQIYSNDFVKVGQNAEVPTITKGLDWVDKHLDLTKGGSGYLMYSVERVGLASGYKYFGQKDWYKLGSTYLLGSQADNGSWNGEYGPIVETSYNLLFLVRGRNPVLFNRLEYSGDWNNRPRAVANLCAWITKTFEREVSWQIINTKVAVEEWHDAPILLVTGSKKPEFTDEEVGKLKTYCLQGGMLLTVCEGGSAGKPFDTGMRAVYRKMFPDYELVQLPPNHPLYSSYFKMPGKGIMWGLSNGSRILGLHCTDDLPLVWQKNQTSTVSEAFQLAANVFFFATDRASLLRARGTTLWPEAKPVTGSAAVDIVRLKHRANWNPDPLAWERFKLVMGNEQKVKVNLSEKDVKDLADSDKIAVMTGTTELNLDDSEKAAIKKFVAAGGTLVVDASGGIDAFAKSAQQRIGEMFGDDALASLDSLSPIYMPKKDSLVPSIKYRRATDAGGAGKKSGRLLAVLLKDRPAVIFSKEDLTTGLLGMPCYTCVGYEPKTAMALMRNIVFNAANLAGSDAPAASTDAAAK